MHDLTSNQSGLRPKTYCLIITYQMMKTIRNLFCLSFMILSLYSCEPEELPNQNLQMEEVSGGTGEYGGDVEDRKGNS